MPVRSPSAWRLASRRRGGPVPHAKSKTSSPPDHAVGSNRGSTDRSWPALESPAATAAPSPRSAAAYAVPLLGSQGRHAPRPEPTTPSKMQFTARSRNRTWIGAHAQGVLLSLSRTLLQRGQDVLEWFSNLRRSPAPLLLPAAMRQTITFAHM
jgi:hypothetical protein